MDYSIDRNFISDILPRDQEMSMDLHSRKIKWPFFCHAYWDEGFWFRIWGYGVAFSKSRLNFSERNGFKKVHRISPNWRVNIIKRNT